MGDCELVAQACLHRMGAQLQLGDITAASSELTTVEQVAHQLRQPVTLWEGSIARAMLALATRPLDKSEALVARALAEGQRAAPEFAIPTERVQRYELCDLRGSLGELEPAIRELVGATPRSPRCSAACLRICMPATGRRPMRSRRSPTWCATTARRLQGFDHEWLHRRSACWPRALGSSATRAPPRSCIGCSCPMQSSTSRTRPTRSGAPVDELPPVSWRRRWNARSTHRFTSSLRSC